MMTKSPIAKAITLLPQQTAVVDWVVNDAGSLELVARAGCGKTFTLLEVVKEIAKRGLGELIIMAYNKSIGDELKAKLERLGIDWKKAQAGTVHSFGYSAWRKVAPGCRIEGDKVFKIIEAVFNDTGNLEYLDQRSTINKAVSLAKQRAFGHLIQIDDDAAWYDLWDYFDLEHDLSDDYTAERIIAAAKKVLRISFSLDREVIDFDDMILAPLVHKARFWQKDWVLVDESQDTNPARRALALAMMKPRGRMIFVGDDRQAIYGFTGADGDAMSLLKKATKAKSLPLNVTMRCPKAVVTEAQRLVADITAHESAPDGLVRSIVYKDLDAEKLTEHDAILCRNTAPLISTAFSLLSKGVACRVEGRDIGEGLIKLAQRWKVKSLEAMLTKLDIYQARETAKLIEKKKEDNVALLEDQLECLRVIIARCQSQGKHTTSDLVEVIRSMFGSSDDKKKVLTLSTVHKSKGREWPRVYILGRAKYMPNKWARQPWQILQEANLEYVAITRAQSELIDIVME